MTHALVLAGGGVTGVAWETGVLLGLRDAGHDIIGNLDLVVGTSAGSTVGAQILSGTDLADLYASQTAESHHEISPQLDLDALAIIFGEMALGGTTTDEQRIRIGELALAATTVDEATRRAVIEKRLPSHDWPTIPLILTAIDAVTGEFATWTKDSAVSLVDAELDELRASGSTIRMIVADAEAIEAMGPNSLDPRFRRVAAEHGRRQGRIATF